jgi:hypothetical protein
MILLNLIKLVSKICDFSQKYHRSQSSNLKHGLEKLFNNCRIDCLFCSKSQKMPYTSQELSEIAKFHKFSMICISGVAKNYGWMFGLIFLEMGGTPLATPLTYNYILNLTHSSPKKILFKIHHWFCININYHISQYYEKRISTLNNFLCMIKFHMYAQKKLYSLSELSSLL